MTRNRVRRAYLTVAEAAAYLGVCSETVRRLARSGQLPAIRVGKLWRFDAELIKQKKEEDAT